MDTRIKINAQARRVIEGAIQALENAKLNHLRAQAALEATLIGVASASHEGPLPPAVEIDFTNLSNLELIYKSKTVQEAENGT